MDPSKVKNIHINNTLLIANTKSRSVQLFMLIGQNCFQTRNSEPVENLSSESVHQSAPENAYWKSSVYGVGVYLSIDVVFPFVPLCQIKS